MRVDIEKEIKGRFLIKILVITFCIVFILGYLIVRLIGVMSWNMI